VQILRQIDRGTDKTELHNSDCRLGT
jgi:hypothetical protein